MIPPPRMFKQPERGSSAWKKREEAFWVEVYLKALQGSAAHHVVGGETIVVQRATEIANLALDEYRKFHDQMWEDELEAGDPEWERE